jgi:hypothetical protein
MNGSLAPVILLEGTMTRGDATATARSDGIPAILG